VNGKAWDASAGPTPANPSGSRATRRCGIPTAAKGSATWKPTPAPRSVSRCRARPADSKPGDTRRSSGKPEPSGDPVARMGRGARVPFVIALGLRLAAVDRAARAAVADGIVRAALVLVALPAAAQQRTPLRADCGLAGGAPGRRRRSVRALRAALAPRGRLSGPGRAIGACGATRGIGERTRCAIRALVVANPGGEGSSRARGTRDAARRTGESSRAARFALGAAGRIGEAPGHTERACRASSRSGERSRGAIRT
jgi:hypothetical protein